MRLRSARQDDFEINVISLIDVMLTLLMFFVMTTTFVQHSVMKVTLPEASETTTDTQRDALIVMIDSNSHYFIDNNEVLNPALDTLKEAISRIGGDNRDRPVILRADAMTPHQAVVTAMDALAQLGFVHLSIATTRTRDASGKEPARP
ncbi:MAG TPA: biopolymer transporter ExbD [Rudaea sp.]|jgi:biopolymer transport protein ExbD|uniref:ExbD/TolR family protein n=1 Tax=Rudaea sp. TaxID=2136325 RepID=UPI002F94F917